MIEPKLLPDASFSFHVDSSIFSEEVIAKTLYWYPEQFIVQWSRNADNVHHITLTYKPEVKTRSSLEETAAKLSRDLLDYKNREIILKETRNIRDILYVKAFANGDDFEDFNLLNEE